MATDDVSVIKSPCPCGKGTIVVTQTMPDHPWVRASQISYFAELDCSMCASKYVVENAHGGEKPRLVLRTEFDAKKSAETSANQAEAILGKSPLLAEMRSELVGLIDGEKSKAARHRMAGKLGFYVPSYGTFIKGATDGQSIVRHSSPLSIAHAATKAGLEISAHLAELVSQAGSLRDEAWSKRLQTVKTGAVWLRR